MLPTSRAVRVAEVGFLRDEGYTTKEIVLELGLSRNYVSRIPRVRQPPISREEVVDGVYGAWVELDRRPFVRDFQAGRTPNAAQIYRHFRSIFDAHAEIAPRLGPLKVLAVANATLRNRMMEACGGFLNFLRIGGEKLSSDEFGTLWLLPSPGRAEDIVVVEVVNSTPEPDGRFKDYFLRCQPELRPLLPGALGEPQEMTARNAIASLAGLRGEEYRPLVET